MKAANTLKMAGVMMGAWMFVACGGDEMPPDTTTVALGKCDAAANWEIWVPRQTANDIKIIKGPEFMLSDKTIDLSTTGLVNPHGVTFNKDRTRAVVAMLGTPDANYANGGVVLIDTKNYSVLMSFVTRAKTHQAVFAPSGDIWAVNVNAPGSISFVDFAGTGTVTGKLELGGQAVAARFTGDGATAYVTNQQVEGENSWVTKVNVGTKAIDGATYKTGKTTVTPAMTTDNKTLFVTNGTSNSVSKIDLENADRTAAVTEFAKDIPEAHAIALGKEHIFVTARMGGRVVVLKPDGALEKNLPVTVATGNPLVDMIALSPSCSKAYFTERLESKVYQIDVDTMAITGTVELTEGYTHGISVLVVDGDM